LHTHGDLARNVAAFITAAPFFDTTATSPITAFSLRIAMGFAHDSTSPSFPSMTSADPWTRTYIASPKVPRLMITSPAGKIFAKAKSPNTSKNRTLQGLKKEASDRL
jgi:hypothetical protein